MKINANFSPEEPTTPNRSTGSPLVSPAARNLALAHRIAELIDQDLITDYTAAAQLLGVSQPRVSHLMGLRLLAPEIQAAILADTIAPADKQLRQLARIADWSKQIELLATFTASARARRRAAAIATSPTS